MGQAKNFKLGLEIQIHGWEKYRGPRKLLADFLLPRASALRVVSQRLKKQLINEFGVEEEKITAVPIYSDLPAAGFQSPAKESKSKFVFLTVGRLVKVKNISLQIKALIEVVKTHPEAELWIVGDGSEKNNYQLNNNIKLLGWQSDLEKYYRQADAFMLTSDYEGWGLAVIEAAYFGLPIIMTDVGCAGEVIRDGESGLVIPVGDKEKLVAAMLKIIADETLRKKLGLSAKLAAGRLPDKEKTLARYLKSWGRAAADKL